MSKAYCCCLPWGVTTGLWVTYVYGILLLFAMGVTIGLGVAVALDVHCHFGCPPLPSGFTVISMFARVLRVCCCLERLWSP